MKTLYRYLTEAEEKQLFSTIKATAGLIAERDLHMFKLMRYSGMRVGTLVAFTVRDAMLALGTGTLTMRAEIQKTGAEHRLPMTKDIELCLRALLRIRREARVGMEQDEALVVSRVVKRFGPMTVRGVQHRFQHWRKAAGLNVNASPHWMRHTLGHRLIRRTTLTDPLRTTAEILGHSNPRSTMFYTAPTREEIALAMREAT